MVFVLAGSQRSFDNQYLYRSTVFSHLESHLSDADLSL